MLYWIQQAAVFAVYHHYFHGYAGTFTEHYRHDDPSFIVELPSLAPLAVGNLPTFLTESTDTANYLHAVFLMFHDLLNTIDMEFRKATVLVNLCQGIKVGALAAVGPHDVLAIGPVLPADDKTNIFKEYGARYMEWLDTNPASFVVYVSFGSLAMVAREQLEEGGRA